MPDQPRPFTVLAFDFGLAHIGVAIGQSVTGTARPLTELPARDGKLRRGALQPLLTQWQPDRLVVGLPLNMDGSESELSARARAFAERLARQTQLPVALTDERLTTREARMLAADGVSEHAMAARLIGESYLSGDSREL
ncbi:MAG: Holliday junction resolvase RuvX [Pseudomonadota bacterium]